MPAAKTQLLEDSIIDMITAEITSGVDVMAFPETAAEYERVVDTPQVWVMLNSMTAGKQRGLGNLVQECDYLFQISLKSHTLRGDNGIYNLYDRVAKAILGKTPQDGTDWIKAVKLQHNGVADGIFDWSFFVQFPGLIFVTNIDPSTVNTYGALSGAPLTEVTLTEE